MAHTIGHLEKVRALGCSGRVLVVGGARTATTSQLSFYDHVGNKFDKRVEIPSHATSIAADTAGFVVACADGVLRWFSRSGDLEREVNAHAGAATGVAIHGDLVASSGADGFVRLWSRKTGAKKKGLSELSLSTRALRAVAIDPAGEAVAGAGDDGVVRVVWLADQRRREMAGHDGAVWTLLFTPADGRVVSGGEDGTTRLWYLAGEIDADVRGKDESGHAGGTTAIAFLPSKNRDEVGERFFTAGLDGKLKLWRTSERRKPRTFETRGNEPLHAIALAAATTGAETTGRVLTAGDARTVFAFTLDAEGLPGDQRVDLADGFSELEAGLSGQGVPKRQETVATLAALDEPLALTLAIRALERDARHEVRSLAAGELAKNGRSGARQALRGRLDDENSSVRTAAFEALRTLEASTPVAALRAALRSGFYDVRAAAVRLLPDHAATSVLVQGLIATHLSDEDVAVRREALTALAKVHANDVAPALRVAFERGAADIRAEALVRAAVAKVLVSGAFAPVVGKALDDDDADVRRIAFVANVLTKPALLAWLEARDEVFSRALADFVRRVIEAEGGQPPIPGLDTVISTVASVGDTFTTFAHPILGTVSIFKPKLHTRIAIDDEVRLIGVRPSDKRATDYLVGAPAPAAVDVGSTRARLVDIAKVGEPTEADRQPLLAALSCRTPDTSLRGARGLALFGDMRALGALLTISREPDPALRSEAAYALLALRDGRAEKRLAWMMSDTVASVRDAALACYAKLETAPLAVAAVALQASYEDVRVRGLDILVKQGKGEPRARELLESALDDEAAVVRAEAFRTLWSWHTADPLTPLDRALTARFPDLRLRAVNELTAIAKHKEGGREAAARERLFASIGDRDDAVAKAAYDATIELRGKTDVDTHLAAIGSSLPKIRAIGAKDAAKGTLDKLRSPLSKLLEDTDPVVRVTAIESLDALSTDEHGPLYIGLQSSHLELRVRAAELLARRRDDQIVSAMQSLIADKEALARVPQVMVPLRQRAATALANLGSPKLLRYFGTDLVKDDDPVVREQASRGISNASRRGEEGYLLDLLGHAEVAVRSWAGEGLARLGDARALPVLTGTLRHEHPPIRVGAIVSFASLGPEGHGGMLQGLEDSSLEVQRMVLSVILARDLRAYRRAEPPELLAAALSSARPEVRFSAARAIELRMSPDAYAAHLVEVFLPEPPDKPEDLAKWPDESTRAFLMMGLAEALAGDRPEQRYAAAQTLRLRDRPLEFFREAERAVRPRSSTSPWIPETSPTAPAAREPAKKGPLAALRRLFAAGPATAEDAPETIDVDVSLEEQQRLRLLAFGAYVGLLRQSTPDDEAHRVRRDAIERVTELVKGGTVNAASATPTLARALDDPNHLVRRAALAALRSLHPADTEVPLSLALASSAFDVVRAALDELVAGGEATRHQVVKALDSNVLEARRYAFSLLEKSAPPGSLEPLLAALGSAHADLRVGVLERLASSQDPRVLAALGKALGSDHEDLRLRAAELLAGRRDGAAVDVLGACLRSDDDATSGRAREALARIGTPPAIAELAARIDEVPAPARVALAQAIGRARGAPALEALAARFSEEDVAVRGAAVAAAISLIGPRADTKAVRGAPKPKGPDQALAFQFAAAAVKSRFPEVRTAGVVRLDDVTDAAADALLVGAFGDRYPEVRARAVASYAARVEKKGATATPLVEVVRAGARETMLPAALGLAARAGTEGATAFRPLLLFVRAGEPGERERALLALGTLGDVRALAELETIASGGTEDAPVDEPMQAAALEALGRMFPRLEESDARERVRDRVESSVASRIEAMAVASVKALRFIADERSRARIAGILASGATTGERRAAAESLGEIGQADGEGSLAKALNDGDMEVRGLAREALEKLFPNERTRIELHAVESEHVDVSAPAAAFLATEGDPAALLSKLGKLSNVSLRARLRYGLARRPSLPGAAIATLLEDRLPSARSDAAWIAAASRDAIAEGERAALGKALVRSVATATEKRAVATTRGASDIVARESEVEVQALWAARRVGAKGLGAVAGVLLTDEHAPVNVRIEASRSLGGEAGDPLERALVDVDLRVRAEANSAVGAHGGSLDALSRAPRDPVLARRAVVNAPLPANAFATPESRRVFTPLALGRREIARLVTHATTAKAEGRLDAIAALGLSPTGEAVAALEGLATKKSEPEDVRKAAYRALRRAQRRLSREETT